MYRDDLHHLVDDGDRLCGIVDVEHQVAHSVDDDQTIPILMPQGIVDDLHTNSRAVFAQADEVEVFAVAGCRQIGEVQDALQYIMAVKAALLRIYIQYTLLAFGQTSTVIQYRSVL